MKAKIYNDIKPGEKYRIYEDGKQFYEGIIRGTYIGTCNEEPCTGVILDDQNGILLDSDRTIELWEEKEEIVIPRSGRIETVWINKEN